MPSIPQAPGAWPLLGHAVPLLRDPLAFLRTLPGYGPLVRVRIGPRPTVAVCDPELTRGILLNDKLFDKGGPFWERVRDVTGKTNIIACPHAHHRRLRGLVQPAFRRELIPGYADLMTTGINAAADGWRDGQVRDLLADVHDLTIKVTLDTLMYGTLPPHRLERLVGDIGTFLNAIYWRMFLPPGVAALPLPFNRRFEQAAERIMATIDQFIAERRTVEDAPADLLAMLLAETGAEGSLTDTELGEQAFAFFGAGVETTASAITWALYLVSCHPGIERRLHQEVDEVTGGAPVSRQHLPGLGLTRAIVTEALRLYPPGWFLTRTLTADTDLAGHRLPAGTDLIYSAYLVHRDAALYDRPDRFDPDRWLRRPAPARTSFVAFGGGARKCVGDEFAMTEAVLAVAAIAARWRLTRVAPHRIRPSLSAAPIPAGLRMKVTART
ncbi:cytochrome P450 [Streptomyces sp. NPDC089919]|uniref:cytochrome P450 n=1 Tax=Streptomyces sp. NPDC089919 TaxID=3155188 RepID=UPI00343C1378